MHPFFTSATETTSLLLADFYKAAYNLGTDACGGNDAHPQVHADALLAATNALTARITALEALVALVRDARPYMQCIADSPDHTDCVAAHRWLDAADNT